MHGSNYVLLVFSWSSKIREPTSLVNLEHHVTKEIKQHFYMGLRVPYIKLFVNCFCFFLEIVKSFGLLTFSGGTDVKHWPEMGPYSVIRQKCESQNEYYKKTKPARFSEKRTFLTPWYGHVHVRVRGKKYLFFGKFVLLCFLVAPVLRFALLLYCQRHTKFRFWKFDFQNFPWNDRKKGAKKPQKPNIFSVRSWSWLSFSKVRPGKRWIGNMNADMRSFNISRSVI